MPDRARAATVGEDGPRNRDAVLVEAACHERDRRRDSYPAKIREGADAEALCLDFQCWVAIAEFVESGRFFGFHGGADPQGPNAPWVGWPELEGAAKKALGKVELRLASEGWLDGLPETPTARRRNALTRIHRAIQLRRATVDSINVDLRRRQQQREGISA